MLRSPKINTLADGVIESTKSMLDEMVSKSMHKDKHGDQLKKKKQSQSKTQIRILRNF